MYVLDIISYIDETEQSNQIARCVLFLLVFLTLHLIVYKIKQISIINFIKSKVNL